MAWSGCYDRGSVRALKGLYGAFIGPRWYLDEWLGAGAVEVLMKAVQKEVEELLAVLLVVPGERERPGGGVVRGPHEGRPEGS